jgi:hypothetical protein
MTSYWKLIDMETVEVLAVGNEQKIIDLKIMYENKLNTITKIIKCFGKDNYNHDADCMKRKCESLLKKINQDSYFYEHNF